VRVEDRIRYPAPPAEVAQMLADPEFVERKCRATGALSHTADVDGSAGGPFTITTTRTMPTEQLPDVARKLVGSTLELRQVEVWEAPGPEGARAGTVTVEILGAPVRLRGTVRLEPDGSGTVETLTGDLTASVPLLGGRLEKAAEPAFLAGVRKEHEVGSAWLAARTSGS
jgi:hypothetical protein